MYLKSNLYFFLHQLQQHRLIGFNPRAILRILCITESRPASKLRKKKRKERISINRLRNSSIKVTFCYI